MEELQHHARLTANIAVRLPVPKHLADIALVTGMLHDVGKLILAWKLPDKFTEMLAGAATERLPLNVVEEREYGFSHAEIGAYLLGLWGLPYTVVESVALHHRPNRVPHQDFDAIAAVYVADMLAHEFDTPSPRAPAPHLVVGHQEELTALGILERVPDWRAIAAEIPARLGQSGP